MSEAYLGEIRLFSFDFPPRGWALCHGQLLPINQNQALFSLLGTTYGGDGRVTFALPDLRGRVPIHFSEAHALGQRAGAEAHTLLVSEMPPHTHPLRATTADASERTPAGNVLAFAEENVYAPAGPPVTLGAALTHTGGTQPHTNLQPYLTLNFSIALVGIFPPRP